MGEFPLLKSGVVAQYPLARSVECATEVLRFVDGSEQRFRKHGAPVRTWVIRLDLLEEEEMAAIEEFFQSEQGRTGNFAFTDPRDGSTYPSCSLASDSVELSFDEPGRGSTVLVVRENRN